MLYCLHEGNFCQLGTLASEFQLSKEEKNDYDPSKDNLGRIGS